jgi:hypothetical protein
MKDKFAKRIWDALYKDFSRLDKNVELWGSEGHEKLMSEGFGLFRDHTFPALDSDIPVHTYKYCAQLENMFNRYIADEDNVTQSDLDCEALKSFVDSQAQILTCLPGSERAHRILQEIRRIVTLILGEVPDMSELVEWRIPIKASVGVTKSEGYLHEKLSHLSGTAEQHGVIDSMLSDCAFKYRKVRTQNVTVTAVEKKWNKSRVIATDTVSSGIITNAIDKHLRKRLLTIGIDLETQQHLHRRLVKEASVKGDLATLDLSAASDSFSIPFMRRVLPSNWYRLLSQIRCRLINKSGGEVFTLQSFMTMGVGFTFPLQTLLFYSVIQAVKNLLRSTMPHSFPGIISVYGDDCIFPTQLFPYVATCFSDLGFKVNVEKSFHTGFFRESCGEDCYKGVSVRPAFFKWKFKDTACNIYSFLNNLLRRFNVLEIPETYRYCSALICYLEGEILLCPPSYPDYAGLHVYDPDFSGRNNELFTYSRVSRFALASDGHRSSEGYCFKCKMIKPPGYVAITDVHDIKNTMYDQLRPKPKRYYKTRIWMVNNQGTLNSVFDIHCQTSTEHRWRDLRFKKGRSRTVGGKSKHRKYVPALLIPKKPKPRSTAEFRVETGEVFLWA